ncbi:aldo/keto reductase [Streptomyces sp. NPDC050997]|uniref:aldo/keto reductase n=1 Tax=Streptomyces sp. NPDC050997 TaxID=3155519 RepID=UPI00341794A4
MKKRRIGGESGFDASALCLGGMHFGTKTDEATAFAILDRFLEVGGTFIDTANTYAFWPEGGTGEESEALLGRWLRSRGVRDQVVLATKVGALPVPLDAPWPQAAEGLSTEVIERQVKASLDRLGTDRIDVYYAHIEDRRTPLEETVTAFGDMVARGMVQLLGCSNHAAWRIERARALARQLGVAGYTCVQQRATYLQPRPGADFGANPHAGDELLDYVRSERELTLLGYSTLLGGALSRSDRPVPEQYNHPGTPGRLSELGRVAEELGASPNQVALAWHMHSSPSTLPVIGVSSVAQLDECLAAVDLEMDAHQLDRLNTA